MTQFVGVDPGKEGAIALWGQYVIDLPYLGDEPDVRAITAQFREWEVEAGDTIAIEYQAAFSRPGASMGVTSAFQLGKGYGMLLTCAYLYGLRVLLPRPAAWKKAYALIGKDKDASRQLATQMFPWAELARKKDHGRAEALLIADWARKQA